MAGADISPHGAETVDIVTGAIALVFILFRLYVQAYFSRFSASDVLIVLAWIFFVANSATDFYSNKWGFWDPRIDYKADGILPDFEAVIKDRRILLKGFYMLYSTATFYHLDLYFVKMAFLIMYMEIFPPNMTKLRKALWGSIAFVTAGYIVIVFQQLFWCIPVSRNWTMDPKDRCLTWAAPTPWYFAAGFHIVSDFLVYALPFFLLPTLIRAASRKKIAGIVFMFSLGLLCILTTVGRLINVGRDANAAVVSAWCSAESFSAIIVACILPLKRMWMAWTYRADHASPRHSRSRSWVRSKHSLIGTNSWRRGWFWNTGRSKQSTRLTGDGDLEDGKATFSTREDGTVLGLTSVGAATMDDREFAVGLAPRKTSRVDDEILPVDSNRMLYPPTNNARPKSGSRWKWRWNNSSSNDSGTKGSGLFGGGGKGKKVKELGNLTFGSTPGSLTVPRASDTSLPVSPGRLARNRDSGLINAETQSSPQVNGADTRASSSDGDGEGSGSMRSMTFGQKG